MRVTLARENFTVDARFWLFLSHPLSLTRTTRILEDKPSQKEFTSGLVVNVENFVRFVFGIVRVRNPCRKKLLRARYLNFFLFGIFLEIFFLNWKEYIFCFLSFSRKIIPHKFFWDPLINLHENSNWYKKLIFCTIFNIEVVCRPIELNFASLAQFLVFLSAMSIF